MTTWWLVLAGVGLVALVGWFAGRRWRSRVPATLERRLAADRTKPDVPVPFGREITWLAVRTEDVEALASALDLGTEAREPCNWAHGVDGASGMSPRIFLTPPVQGWTFALGGGLPVVHDPKDVSHLKGWLIGVSRRFGDVCYFASHAGASHYGWARAEAGTFVRGLSVNHGQIAWNEGPITDVERRLDPSFDDPQIAGLIGEGHVQMIATAWSLDPMGLEQRASEEGLGVLGKGWVNLDTRAR